MPWVCINQGTWQRPGRPALCRHAAAPAHTGVGWGFCSHLGYSQRLQIGYKLRVEAKNSSSSLNPKALTFLHVLMMHFLFLGRVQIWWCIIIILRPSLILKLLAFKYIITLGPGTSIFLLSFTEVRLFFSHPSLSLKTKSVQIIATLAHFVRRIQSSMYAGFTEGPTNCG